MERGTFMPPPLPPQRRAGPLRRRRRPATGLALLATAAVVAVTAASVAHRAASQECLSPVSTCDGSVDLFPTKIDPILHSTTLTNVTYTPIYADIDVTVDAEGPPLRYRFVRCGCAGVAPADGRTVVSIPPTRLYVGDTSTLSQLVTEVTALDRVAVIGNVFVTYSPTVQRRVAAGLTRSLITDPSEFIPDYTQLLNNTVTGGGDDRGPLLALVPARDRSRFLNETAQAVPFVSVGELLELTPLGRAEYVQFLALLTDRPAQGSTAFSFIRSSYETSKAAAAAAVRRPSVLVGFPVGDSWTQPAERSYAAALLADANLDHRYQGNNATTPTFLDLPSTVEDFGSADLWINAGLFPGSPDLTLDQLLAANATQTELAFARLESVRCGNVWINQREVSADGMSNNYFEEGAVRPDKVLADLVRLAHPTAAIPGSFNYYYSAGQASNLSCPHATLPVQPVPPDVYVDTDVRVTGGLSRWDVEDVLVSRVYPELTAEANIAAADVEVFVDTPPEGMPAGAVDLTVRVRRTGPVASDSAEELGAAVVRALDTSLPLATDVTSRSVSVVAGPGSPGDGGGNGNGGGGTSGGNGDGGGLSGGGIAGIVIGCLAALALAALVGAAAFRRGRTRGAADRDAYWAAQEARPMAESTA
ncbi:hypothetical protein MMPV_004792 [Pyropia vietnamensis]